MLIIGEDQEGLFCMSTSEALCIHLYIGTGSIGVIQIFPTRTKEGGWTVYQSGSQEDLTSKYMDITSEWTHEHQTRNEAIINLRPGA